MRTLTEGDARRMLPPRRADCHKGDNGRALLCVGSEAYTGAALLCAGAALRAGAGITTAAVPRTVKPAFAALLEVCCTPVGGGGTWDAAALFEAAALLSGKDVIAMGCGMGPCENESLLLKVLETKKPLVLDADGLNLLARCPGILDGGLHENVVLTPHPMEMARLTGRTVAQITADPAACAKTYAARWHCVVLLKGAASCVAGNGDAVWNETGNSGLAKGGSGDVLTGLITGLLAQKTAPFDAAALGAYLLGISADRALELLQTRMLIARDVIGAVEATIGSFYSV